MTKEQRHLCMSHIHSKDTTPEIILRRELFRRGYRFRLNQKSLPGSPDIVLAKYRTAIFVNGCFWHGHRNCRLYVMPRTNVEFWKAKIKRNRERDRLNIQRLEALDWNVITVWECSLAKKRLAATLQRVEKELADNREKWLAYKEECRRNRFFAVERAREHRELVARLESEIDSMYTIPGSVRRLSHKTEE